MLRYAKSQFYWAEQQPDGSTNRDHINAARKNAFASTVGPIEDEDEEDKYAPCPSELEYIYRWFVELSSTRQSGMSMSPIVYQEIQAWAALSKLELSQFEIRTIKRIDVLYLQHFRDKS